MKKLKEISISLLGVLVMIAVLGGLGFMASLKPLIILALTTLPAIVTYFKLDDTLVTSKKQANEISSWFNIMAICCALIMFFQYSLYKNYLDQKIISGKIKSEDYTYNNEDGDEMTDTSYYFVPTHKEDGYKVSMIELWMLTMIIATPVYVIAVTYKISKKFQADEKRKYFDYS